MMIRSIRDMLTEIKAMHLQGRLALIHLGDLVCLLYDYS